MKFPGISTDKQFLKKLKVQCDLGEKMFVSKSNSMEIYIFIKNTRVSFLKLKEIYRRILTIPVSSAIAKRSFSTMKKIKTYSRSTMTGKRLHKLALLSRKKKVKNY